MHVDSEALNEVANIDLADFLHISAFFTCMQLVYSDEISGNKNVKFSPLPI